MDSFTKSSSTKRFVVEDTFTKVTSDGQPHGMMTMIAAISGLLTAIVILTILASVIGCTKNRRSRNCKKCQASKQSKENITRQASTTSEDGLMSTKRFSFLTLLRRGSSVTKDSINYDGDARPRLVSISCISNGNLEGNLNAAFTSNEFQLGDILRKKPGEMMVNDEPSATKETIINVEKY